MINRKLVGGVITIAAVVIVVAVWCLVKEGAPASRVSKDPADVVLKASDLPAGYLVEIEGYVDADTVEQTFQTVLHGFETGYMRVLEENLENNGKLVFSVALRFSSADGAKELYYDYIKVHPKVGENVVHHSTIGDQSYIVWSQPDAWYVGVFRKQNFVVYQIHSTTSESECENYLQIVENRI